MERDSKRQRSSKNSSDKRRREREEQERRERDRHRRERETSDRERQRRETDERERDRLRRERRDRERERDSHRRSGREREDPKRSERQREERKRTERRDKERHEREEESRESYERKGQKKETHRHESEETRQREDSRIGRMEEFVHQLQRQERESIRTQSEETHERPESWAQRMDAFAQQLQRHERESIRPQTSSDSRVTSTYIPPRTVSQTEESYTESTYSPITGATQRITDIPRFFPPFVTQGYPSQYPPQFPPPFPPQYGWPGYASQYSGSASQTASYDSPPPIRPSFTDQYSRPPVRTTSMQIQRVINDPHSQRMDIVLSQESNWYSQRAVSSDLVNRMPKMAGVVGKASYNRRESYKTADKFAVIFFNYVKRFAVYVEIDPIRWYLYIDRMLFTGYQQTAEQFGLQNFRENGYHIFVNKNNLLLTLFVDKQASADDIRVGIPLAINSVIPFCRNGKVCYGMQIVNNAREGLRFWWYGKDADMTKGFYEIYDSYRYETRLRFFKVSSFYTGILLHNDAKLLFKDEAFRELERGEPKMKYCTTLYCGATFIMFERKFAVYIESEQILVSLEDLFNCGAIADINVLNHKLILLQEIRSQTCSSVWALNLDTVEASPQIRLNKTIIIRIPDRNAISYMWYWNSDFKDGLKYVEWYQSITDWSTKFEFESHPFAPPFAGTPKPQMEPKKLWLGTDPKHWLLQSSVNE